jgi:DNA polymerase-4
VARDIQQRVRRSTRLDCSVGIGHNKLQAKMATGFGKPAGVYRIIGANWLDLFGDRPTESVWGIGRGLAKRLAALGITTVGELAAVDPAALVVPFGPTIGPWLAGLGHGSYDSPVDDTPRAPVSRSREVTFQVDLAEWAEVRHELATLVDERSHRGRSIRDPGVRQGAVRSLHHGDPFEEARRRDHGRGCGGAGRAGGTRADGEA